MSFRVLALLVPLLLVATGCGSGSSSGDDSTVRLRIATSQPAEHYMVKQVLTPWMDRITKETDGRVQFELFPAEQLGSLSDSLSMLRQGTADIAYVPPAFFAGEMPLSEVHTLPGMFSDSAAASKAMTAASQESPIYESDYKANDIRLLWGNMTVPYNVFTKDREVSSVSDLQGLTLKSGGGYQDVTVKALGASAVTIPSPETYQSLQTGTVDGAVFPTSSAASYKLEEVTKHATIGFDLSSFFAAYTISSSAWDSLSDEDKHIVEAANAEAVEVGGKLTDDLDQDAIGTFEETGMQIKQLPETERAKLDADYADIREQWVSDLEDSGKEGQAALDLVQGELDKAAS